MPSWDFESIYTAFSRMVYWTAYSFIKNENDAMDISQEVFIRVIKHIAKLRNMEEAQLKSWLYRVIHNLCMDRFRKTKYETVTDEMPESCVVDEDQIPELSAIRNDDMSALKKAVDELPGIYRETVMLYYFSRLQYDEIAGMQGVSVGTVKSRMFRAKSRLAAVLEGGERVEG